MPSLRLLAPLAAAGVLAGLGAPATAPATPITEVTYRVTVEASAEYEHVRFRDFGFEHTQRASVAATARTRAVMTDITFRNGRLINAMGAGTATHEVEGSGTTKRTTMDLDGVVHTEHGSCEVGGPVTAGIAEMRRDPDLSRAGVEVLDIRAATFAGAGFDCSIVDVGDVLFTRGLPFGEDTLDLQVDVPNETVGMGKIIHLVSAPPAKRSPQFCPGADAYTESCTFTWNAKVTFEKTDEQKYGFETLPPGYDRGEDASDDDLIVPLVPERPSAPPAQTPRATPQAPVVNRLTPSIARKVAALSKRGLTFTAACPQGCTGTADVLGRGGRRVARARFRVAAGAPRKVTVKLSRKARKAVQRTRGAKLRVTLKPRGGKATKATLAVKR